MISLSIHGAKRCVAPLLGLTACTTSVYALKLRLALPGHYFASFRNVTYTLERYMKW